MAQTDQRPAGRRPKQIVTKTITVPGNLVQACREFNSGRFFACHETLEEIWQEEQGDVRDLYKGLIQVAAAFVHVTRANYHGASRLLTTALAYLAPYRAEGAMGFDLEAICAQAEAALAHLEEVGPGRTHELYPALAPTYAVDLAALAGESERWQAWGFDRHGNAVEMQIEVAE
ncbi:MAG: DUF309 domain-containing protein [Chloroflexi bacterium]|nr:DUF309 domain-containing protein [Chloroflexota bacterium]